MNWYLIEYSGKKNNKVYGTCNEDIIKILQDPNPPKFLKIENKSFLSKVTGKFELFSFWNSSSGNEVYIRTDCIISVEILQEDLLNQAVKGEIKAFKFHQNLTIIVSDSMYSKHIESADYSFIEAIQQLSRNRTFRKKHFITHPLIKDNEIMVAIRGSIILHEQLEEEGRNGVLKLLESYYDDLYKRKLK